MQHTVAMHYLVSISVRLAFSCFHFEYQVRHHNLVFDDLGKVTYAGLKRSPKIVIAVPGVFGLLSIIMLVTSVVTFVRSKRRIRTRHEQMLQRLLDFHNGKFYSWIKKWVNIDLRQAKTLSHQPSNLNKFPEWRRRFCNTTSRGIGGPEKEQGSHVGKSASCTSNQKEKDSCSQQQSDHCSWGHTHRLPSTQSWRNSWQRQVTQSRIPWRSLAQPV